jgi:hypothetical protein
MVVPIKKKKIKNITMLIDLYPKERILKYAKMYNERRITGKLLNLDLFTYLKQNL